MTTYQIIFALVIAVVAVSCTPNKKVEPKPIAPATEQPEELKKVNSALGYAFAPLTKSPYLESASVTLDNIESSLFSYEFKGSAHMELIQPEWDNKNISLVAQWSTASKIRKNPTKDEFADQHFTLNGSINTNTTALFAHGIKLTRDYIAEHGADSCEEPEDPTKSATNLDYHMERATCELNSEIKPVKSFEDVKSFFTKVKKTFEPRLQNFINECKKLNAEEEYNYDCKYSLKNVIEFQKGFEKLVVSSEELTLEIDIHVDDYNDDYRVQARTKITANAIAVNFKLMTTQKERNYFRDRKEYTKAIIDFQKHKESKAVKRLRKDIGRQVDDLSEILGAIMTTSPNMFIKIN